MKLLEVPTALKRASKSDLFVGDIHNLNGVQAIKDNATVFYRHSSGTIEGPKMLNKHQWFRELYEQMLHGMIGVIIPVPANVTNEFIFDLVLREASVEDLKDAPLHIKLNRMYYTYADNKLIGPLYTNNSTTHLYIDSLVARKQIFVPNERQHFKKKEYRKTA